MKSKTYFKSTIKPSKKLNTNFAKGFENRENFAYIRPIRAVRVKKCHKWDCSIGLEKYKRFRLRDTKDIQVDYSKSCKNKKGLTLRKSF